MSKKYQIFLTCYFVITASNVFAESNYAQLQKQVIVSDAVLNSLKQSQQAYEINKKFAGRLNNPTFNVELDNLGNSKLKDLDGPTTLLGVSQEIPLSNKLSLRKQIASFEGDRNQFDVMKRQAELKADFRICMANWYVATERANIYSSESKLNARQANVLAERLKYGRVIQSDAQLSAALSSESKLRYQNELKNNGEQNDKKISQPYS